MEEEINVKVEENMDSNPWSVEDATVFLKYCCPECDFQVLNLKLFSSHALENHVRSIALFDEKKLFEQDEHFALFKKMLEIERNANFYENPKEKIENDDHIINDHNLNSEHSKIIEENILDLEQKQKDKKKKKRKRLYVKKFKCQVCDLKISSKKNLMKHTAKLHTKTEEDGGKKCDICFLGFLTEFELREHKTKDHQRDDQKSCSYCDWTTKVLNVKKPTWQQLKNHIESNHPEHGQKKNLCDGGQKCDLCFLTIPSSKLELRKHRTKDHQRDGKISCSYCDWTFEIINVKAPNWQLLKNHIESNHPEHGEKKNLCDVCGQGFIYESSCRMHKERHQKHTCHICTREFLQKDSLKEHLMFVHKDKEYTNHVCETCGFSTPSRIQLKKHIRVKHLVEKHKKCPHCNYHTARLGTFHVHIDSKHPEHGEKQFFCNHCPRSFIFEDSLKKHLDNQRTMARHRSKKIMDGLMQRNRRKKYEDH